ncbi:MAG: helix-turn-helix transcriptional regulator [Acidimicrobiales bacterium]
MEDSTPVALEGLGGTARFQMAPPRRFILPAILLLLSEQPGYGYSLLPRLQEFRFGHVDRPAVYRALAQLEGDGLVQAFSQSPKAGQARRVYRVTPLGERVLRVWMGVVKEEHDYLGRVLRRYLASGRTDAVLAEIEGGWAAPLRVGWSPVSSTSSASSGSSTSSGLRRLTGRTSDPETLIPPARTGCRNEPRTFGLVPDRSVVLIEVRSTVGPLSFGATGVTGSITTAMDDGVLRSDITPVAHLEVDVSGLRSGNRLYDAELLRRIDARRFPKARVELHQCAPGGPGGLYRLEGEVTFHGSTRPAQGTVELKAISPNRLKITGEQVFDIRDFAIPSPTVLMLRIYPDVRVRLYAEAELEDQV